jgi:GTP-binding protein
LHLAILIERIRREGYEFEVSRPQVIEKMVDGVRMTPFERLFVEVPEQYSGVVMQKMGTRRGDLQDMQTENGVVFFEFIIATKDLFGYRSEFITDSHGMGIINSSFLEYRQDKGVAAPRDRGSLTVHEGGSTKLYGLTQIQDRGQLFIGPATEVYKGQVIGQNARPGDLAVNVCKEKQQTNMRSRGEGTSEHFDAPKLMGLEESLEYIDDTELVEVTPKNIRIRKIILDEIMAKKAARGLI